MIFHYFLRPPLLRSATVVLRSIACVIAIAFAFPVVGQTYPARPIRFIVPFAAGGGTDIAARVYASDLSRSLGTNVVVDNRPGAAGAIGVELTANATPDGYTICVISASHAINSATNRNLPYDLAQDVQGVSQITSAFLVLVVHPSLPVKSVKDLIAYARANDGKLNYGSSGTGGISHLAGAMFAHMTHAKLEHIPYRGEAAAITDLLSGRTQLQFASPLNAAPHITAGRVRPLAVTSVQRSPAAPEVPTIAEAGLPGYEVSQWYGVVTSANVPRVIVSRLSAAIAASASAPGVRQRLASDGLETVSSTPERFSAHVRAEIGKWRKLVQDAGLDLH